MTLGVKRQLTCKNSIVMLIASVLFLFSLTALLNQVFPASTAYSQSNIISIWSLPEDALLNILEFIDDLRLAEISKSWKYLIEEKYRQRLPANFPDFERFLLKRNGNFSLIKAKTFLKPRFNEKVLPILHSAWCSPKSAVNEVDDPDICFNSVLINFREQQSHEDMLKRNLLFSQLAYELVRNGFSGYEEIISPELETTPLHTAVISANESLVLILLKECQVDPNLIDNFDKTPLVWACEIGNFTIVKLLLEHGADAHVLLRSKNLPLHAAAESGYMEILTTLIDDAKVNLNCKNFDGETVLHAACRGGQREVAEYLILNRGINFKLCSKTGQTVLHSAMIGRNIGIIDFLLDIGIDPYIKDENGENAIHCAAETDFLEGIKFIIQRHPLLLISRNNDDESILHIACRSGSLNVVSELLISEASVEARDCEGFTPIHSVISSILPDELPLNGIFNRLRILHLLINHGADVNAKTKIQNTALHIASYRGINEAVRILTGSGRLNLELRNINGRTAAEVARASGHSDIANSLEREFSGKLNCDKLSKNACLFLLITILGVAFPDYVIPLLAIIMLSETTLTRL